MGRTYHLGKKQMTTSPAKSKIHPPALGLDPPPKKGEKLKTPKMLKMAQKSFWLFFVFFCW